ncbi:anhydro-N-acetylmuramic acid kinase [Arthrobacter pigmenti]|nr:anhydro-N-acetylmuramic acid kinase [Arthrobacter pigmenti]
MRIVGLMSGTSYDAIDAAAVDVVVDGSSLVVTPLGMVSEPYSEELRAELAGALPPSKTTMEQVCRLDTGVGQAFAGLAKRANEELCGGRADFIASHGQTVFHWVEEGTVRGTLQLGQPAWIAEVTGCPVISDFRSRDVAAGGQGAPLVSAFDVLWLRAQAGRPVALNLGGIANITVGGDSPLAFDTGPANALMDAAVAHLTDGRQQYDHEGQLARRGKVHPELFARLLAEPYYDRPAPKTTGKELFHLPYLLDALKGLGSINTEDVIATLNRLTARTVADAVRSVQGTAVIASGGGTKNPALMDALQEELGGMDFTVSDQLGVPSDAKEAIAFAVLGFLSVHGIPASVLSCTGARHASRLGSITPGSGPLVLPQPMGNAPESLRIGGARQ